MAKKRQRVWVDQKVQGALARRVASYWAVCLWGTFCVLVGFPIAVTQWFGFENGPSAGQLIYQTWLDFWPSLAASLLVLPIVIWDVLRVSHRFAGPMVRLRHGLRDLADGKTVRPMKFREGDFWTVFADEFNRLAESLETRKAAPQEHEDAQEPAAV